MLGSQVLISSVQKKMRKLGATQAQVANACGFSQAHLSRVLANRLPLAKKTRERLQAWLDDDGSARAEIAAIVDRIVRADDEKRSKVLAVLRALETALV